MAHDASPSWSGFNYQGKVALFHALFLINENLLLNTNFDFSTHTLVLENTEDFEIQVNGINTTIHQVKAYQSSDFSSYKNALFGLALELEKNQNALGYIHTWKTINPKSKMSLKASLSGEFAGVVSEYLMSYSPGDTIIGKAASSAQQIPKRAAILRAAFPAKTEGELLNILEDIRVGKNLSLDRVVRYLYPDGNLFCDLLEINKKIKAELSRAFAARAIFNSAKQIENAFHFFLGALDEYIISRHLKFGAVQVLPIEFTRILAVLETNFDDVSQEYLQFEFKSAFLDRFDEFMSYPDLYTQPGLDQDGQCNLTEIQKLLSPMSPNSLWKLYERFSPHLSFGAVDNLNKAITTDVDSILTVLLEIFYTLDHAKADHDLPAARLAYKSVLRPGDVYLPTTIRSELKSSIIARRIFENPGMIEALFEINHLIYNGVLITNIEQHAGNHTVPPDDHGDDRRQKRIDIGKNLRLVPTATAKEEMNAD